ncbi:hypothetical protein F4808DRAFT_362525 [Astrocystis sublimbata]|nr:hypothetical protein F4808DRAFT_362525 [Astrocystis sublimbata]
MATSSEKSSDGLFRMGTHSMSKAYRILGFETFHALDDPWNADWVRLEKAAEGTWPTVPHARSRPPFSRNEWDELWGNQYDAVCDTSAPFTLDLFRAYPDAKVVIVQRDFESWWPSFQSEILDNLFSPLFSVLFFLAWHLVRYRAGHAMTKTMLGFFGAKNREEIEAHARDTYEMFYRELRGNVPPAQRLEYKMGSGWEPLCSFLGKEVPDVPFPFSNERDAHAADVSGRKQKLWLSILKRSSLVGILSIAAIGAAWWFST